MIYIREQKKILQQTTDPFDSPYEFRPETRFIIIHDTRTKKRFSKKYWFTADELRTYYARVAGIAKELQKFFKAAEYMEAGVHYIFDFRKKTDWVSMIQELPLSAVGNHAGLFFDHTSIGIALVGNLDYWKVMPYLFQNRVLMAVLDLAHLYSIPAENVLTETEAYALLAAGFYDTPERKEILARYWDRSPGYVVGKMVREMRYYLVSKGLRIDNPDQFDFLEHYNDELWHRRRGVSVSAKAAYAKMRGEYSEKHFAQYVKEMKKKEKNLKELLKRSPNLAKGYLNIENDLEELDLLK